MSPRATSPNRAQQAVAVIFLAAAFLLAATLPTAAQPAADPQLPLNQRALLSLSVNRADQGEALVIVRAGDVLIEVATLERAGLRNFQGRRETVDGRPFVSLASLAPGIAYDIDERALTLKLTAAAGFLGAVALDLTPVLSAFEYARATSAFLNYGVNWNRATGADGSIEAGVSVGPALAQNTMSWNPGHGFIRGLTSIILDQRERLRRWTIGDSLVPVRSLGSGMLIGGVRVAREYGLNPYFVQFPTLGLSGTTLTPSTVEVYVNDRLVSRSQVAPGAFTIANVPMPNGSNDTRVVVRDAFGREQQMAAAYYMSTTALARGLQDYDYSVGYPRLGGTGDNWTYGGLSALARHRYGFTDRVTAGFEAEADGRGMSVGPTFNFRLHTGELELAAAASRFRSQSGVAFSATYVRTGRWLSVSARVRSMSAGYSNLTLWRPEDRMKVEAAGNVGAQIGSRLALSLQQAVSDAYVGGVTSHTSLIGSFSVARATSVFVNASWSRQSGQDQNSVYGGISVALGPRTNASAWAHAGSAGGGASAEVQRSLPLGNGIGYRARTALGGTSQAEGMVEAQGPYGRYEAGQELLDGETAGYASVAGGLVVIGGGVHPTRPVNESYALVRVPEVGGVRTYLNNQEIGRTNRHGDTLMSNLLPYYANRVAISDQDVPFDRDIEQVERSIAPPYRGGALVVFRADERRTVTGTVVLEVNGQTVLPALGEFAVSVGNRSVSSPIGRDGEFYLENLPAGRHPAVVLFNNVTCQVTLDVPVSAAPVVRVGVVRCVPPEVKEPWGVVLPNRRQPARAVPAWRRGSSPRAWRRPWRARPGAPRPRARCRTSRAWPSAPMTCFRPARATRSASSPTSARGTRTPTCGSPSRAAAAPRSCRASCGTAPTCSPTTSTSTRPARASGVTRAPAPRPTMSPTPGRAGSP